MIPWFQRVASLAAMFALGGCGSYQLGSPETALPSRIHLAPVVNRAEVPQVRAMLTDSLRETFLRAGGWQLREAESADALVQVTVVAFERDTAATSSVDTGRGLSFETRLVAEVFVVAPETGVNLIPPFTVSASGVALIDPSLPDSEYQSLPIICEDLARQIQDRLAYAWD